MEESYRFSSTGTGHLFFTPVKAFSKTDHQYPFQSPPSEGWVFFNFFKAALAQAQTSMDCLFYLCCLIKTATIAVPFSPAWSCLVLFGSVQTCSVLGLLLLIVLVIQFLKFFCYKNQSLSSILNNFSISDH